MYVATGGPNLKWGAPISNGGSGTTGLPAGDGPGEGYIVDLAWPRLVPQPAKYLMSLKIMRNIETFYGCFHRNLPEKKCGLKIMNYSELLVWTHSAVFWTLCKLLFKHENNRLNL